jgi:hypothetical protein
LRASLLRASLIDFGPACPMHRFASARSSSGVFGSRNNIPRPRTVQLTCIPTLAIS